MIDNFDVGQVTESYWDLLLKEHLKITKKAKFESIIFKIAM